MEKLRPTLAASRKKGEGTLFIPIEGEDCIYLPPVIALVRGDGQTWIYRDDGTVATTGFRPLTLARRYSQLKAQALSPFKNQAFRNQEGESS